MECSFIVTVWSHMSAFCETERATVQFWKYGTISDKFELVSLRKYVSLKLNRSDNKISKQLKCRAVHALFMHSHVRWTVQFGQFQTIGKIPCIISKKKWWNCNWTRYSYRLLWFLDAFKLFNFLKRSRSRPSLSSSSIAFHWLGQRLCSPLRLLLILCYMFYWPVVKNLCQITNRNCC